MFRFATRGFASSAAAAAAAARAQAGASGSGRRSMPSPTSSQTRLQAIMAALGAGIGLAGAAAVWAHESGSLSAASPGRQRVLATGRALHGQLGLGDESSVLEPAEVTVLAPEDVRSVACGHMFSAAIVGNDGAVLTWGQGRSGQLGHGSHDNESIPQVVEALEGTPIAALSCGAHHMAAVDTQQRVWTWGLGDDGRLGHADGKDALVPRQVQSISQPVRQVGCGDAETFFLLQDGRVLQAGRRTIALGRPDHVDPARAMTPQPVPGINDRRIVHLSAGSGHAAFLDDQGRVYTIGVGDCGQIGDGKRRESYQATPKLVRALAGHRVTHVECGHFHTLAVTDKGDVFSWGRGQEGQLGHGDDADQAMPRRIDALAGRRVRHMAAGGFHSVVVCDDAVYVFGKNRDGQLGRGDVISRLSPYPVEQLASVLPDIQDVQCGSGHTLYLLTSSQ